MKTKWLVAVLGAVGIASVQCSDLTSFQGAAGASLGGNAGSAGASAGGSAGSAGSGGGPLPAESIKGLSAAVNVSYDKYDVPALSCTTQLDCYRVLGYIHARDRFFQMDLLRREAEGKLSELLGSTELGTDQYLRTLFTTQDGGRLEEELSTHIQTVDPATYGQIQAYVDGVNAYLTQMQAGQVPVPTEYSRAVANFQLATDIVPWRVQDSAAIMRLQQFALSESIGDELSWGQFYTKYATGAMPDLKKMDAYVRAQQPIRE